MKVLIIEDDAMLAMLFEETVQDAGHEPTCIAGVIRHPDQFIGIAGAGNTVLDLSQFDFAAVDGQLIGDLSGWEVVPLLVQAGVTCVGISSDSESNAMMRQAGAVSSLDKMRVMRELPGLIAQTQGARDAA